MGGAELLILLVILFFGPKRLPALGRFFGMREFRREAARSGDVEGKEIAANAGKGEGSV
jgi:Sec-independent protein translocase protein TatA